MTAATQAILEAWRPPPGLTLAMLLASAVYVRGWFAIRRTRAAYFTTSRLLCFLAGMLTLWLSIASPIDGFADVLLSAHMVQHLLLMSVVPPLVLLGAPVVPLLRGLPRWSIRIFLGPLIAWRWVRSVGDFFTTPVVAWLSFNLVFLAWHVPAAYDFALRNEHVHDFEHICFLATSLLFWWVILRPWPGRVRSNNWMLLPYLLSADVVNTSLSAFLAFCNRPMYQYYVTGPNPFHADPLSDQVLGAVIMWVLGSLVFLVPAMLLTVRLMSPARSSSMAALPSVSR
ncbi:MAG: cytochrome c oxidase assembly protein [Acidobacteriaceae bacterium]